jgi:hypothetical protein
MNVSACAIIRITFAGCRTRSAQSFASFVATYAIDAMAALAILGRRASIALGALDAADRITTIYAGLIAVFLFVVAIQKFPTTIETSAACRTELIAIERRFAAANVVGVAFHIQILIRRL